MLYIYIYICIFISGFHAQMQRDREKLRQLRLLEAAQQRQQHMCIEATPGRRRAFAAAPAASSAVAKPLADSEEPAEIQTEDELQIAENNNFYESSPEEKEAQKALIKLRRLNTKPLGNSLGALLRVKEEEVKERKDVMVRCLLKSPKEE